MAYILNIDTATETASICLTSGVDIISFQQNEEQREHASFLHTAIANMLEAVGLTLEAMDAFAITSGPGSYTGLRVGMAAAKGFCYALNKPLIAFNTLAVMTNAAKKSINEAANINLFCPMIDARRSEVFTALYNADLEVLVSPQPVLLDGGFLADYLDKEPIAFFGSGSTKFSKMVNSDRHIFLNSKHNAADMADLAIKAFDEKSFIDVSYVEPTYLKAFYNVAKSL